jgi:delta 1-pyrroline-5-carboxylate dehydrogenase
VAHAAGREADLHFVLARRLQFEGLDAHRLAARADDGGFHERGHVEENPLTERSSTNMQLHERLYINGEWVKPHASGALDVIGSSTEEVIGRVPEAGAEDVDRAVAAARAAFDRWSRTPPLERAQHLRRIHDGLAVRKEELARMITAEVGMPLGLSRSIQAALPVSILASYAELLPAYAFEETIGNSVVVREPVGVVAAITPGTTRCTRWSRSWRPRWRRAARWC